MGGGAPGKAPPNQRSDLAPRPLSPGWDEVCRAIGELGVTAWAASCPPIPCPGSPSPHRKPLETFRETGCGLAAPFGYSISGVHRLWPKRGVPQLPSLQGWVGEVVGSLQRVLILLLRLGVGRERNGGSSKEQLDSFGGGNHRIRVNAGLFIVLCLLEWGLHCLLLGGCASV